MHESASPGPEDELAPPTRADLRMAEILSDKTRPHRKREELQNEASPMADDLLGRLNAMDFIDSVLGEDYEVPNRIGDYEISGVLGRGGMGTVYKAYQATLDREIALKVLAPRFSSDLTMRKRFRTEAKATAAMHHQHIVPIYGYGEASGHLFFAMELVAGVSLDKHITVARRKSEGAMDPLEAARRFAGVADALALAHKRQILHRDVKPGNLLIHNDGTLALADFGLSKFLGEVSAHLTSVGGFLGTLHYAPPEQARGEDLGPESDLYSLGVTLFETVTGKLPVYGQSTEAMLHALLNDQPLRLRQVMPKAPRDLDAVLAKLLNKDPRERYQDGESLALDLIRIAEGEPVRIRRESLAVRLYRRAKRNPVLTAGLGVLLVLIIVTGLWFQSLLVNQSITKETVGRQHLAKASVAVAREPGSPCGPLGLLDALTGGVTPAAVIRSEFLDEIEAAGENLADFGPALEGYRESYFGGALAAAEAEGDPVRDLKAGLGMRAMETLTRRIEEIEGRFQTDDLGVRIDLYNLYLTRAMASITAAVAEPQSALNDLNLAAFIRSGAILPRLLRAMLSWDPRTPALRLLTNIEPFAAQSPETRQVVGGLLLAFGGLCQPRGSHMMRFDMGYAKRKELSGAAIEMLQRGTPKEEGGYCGIELSLAQFARQVLENLGNSLAMNRPMQSARQLVREELHPQSRLRAWEYTFALLADEPDAATELTIPQQLQGAIHFVRLVQRTLPIAQAESLLRMQALATLLDRAGSVTEGAELVTIRGLATELRARLETWVSPPGEAQVAADAWLKLDERNPEAHLCKFCALVRSEPANLQGMFRALVPAADALRFAVATNEVRSRLLDRVKHGQAGLRNAAAEPWLQKLFKRLSDAGGE